MRAARAAVAGWSREPHAERERVLRAFAGALEEDAGGLAAAISLETGKPPWEARAEVRSMVAKVEISIRAHADRCAPIPGGPAVTRFRPHGVVGVLGPFNYPGHLANGHIVPALLAGNAVVFKPSEQAPSVADRYGAAWLAAGLPAGAFNLLQGGRTTGEALVDHEGLDALCLTGSAATGLAIHRRLAGRPRVLLALEMGGNNPLVVGAVGDARAAAYHAALSAYATAGQRCSCARRLIVPIGPAGDAVLEELARMAGRIRVGPPDAQPEPFMGPVISARVAESLVALQEGLEARGARPLVRLRHLASGTGLVSPGLLDVTAVADREDEEVFGPLLQAIRVRDLDAAIEEANHTAYGLAAGLLSDDPAEYERFAAGVRAGVVNWNQQLTGASSAAAFGGVGLSGNHRPSAYLAADYCSYAVASIELPELRMPAEIAPGFDL
ncbi:MAG: succinylglutamic semialdehyde dehydrogenase [Miltoncostaeaceae bacterium]|jgi:succinylglutamic semialdehyde dehydrogenase|nr:succinylglutamic semialdehyde dehydrogenase [Miltoncostaeaceae bacterium]